MVRIGQTLLALAVAAHALPAHALEADGAVIAFVDQLNATVAPAKAGDAAAIRAACTALVEKAFDIDAMVPVITGEAWQRMDAGQRMAYARGLARRAVSDCASHGSEIAGNSVDIVGVRDGGGGELLIAVKQSKARKRTVIWRVHERSGVLKAVDMTVDGRSLATSARRDAKDVLKRTDGNVIALIRSVGG